MVPSVALLPVADSHPAPLPRCAALSGGGLFGGQASRVTGAGGHRSEHNQKSNQALMCPGAESLAKYPWNPLSDFVCQSCRAIVAQNAEPHRGFSLELLIGLQGFLGGMNIQTIHLLQDIAFL